MKPRSFKKILLPLLALAAALLVFVLWRYINPANSLFHHPPAGVQDGVVFVTSMESGDLGEVDQVLTSGGVPQEEFWALMGEATYWRPLSPLDRHVPGVYCEFKLEVGGEILWGRLYPDRDLLMLDYEQYYVTGADLYEGMAALQLRPNGSQVM